MNVFHFRSAAILLLFFFGFFGAAAQSGPRSAVLVVADEAEAVLRILDKRARGETIPDEDWQKVFASEGYRRLKKRELSLSRPFEDADFRAFALSDELLARRGRLAETLAGWKSIDAERAARKAFAYLPSEAAIRAKIYPVVKPRTNSFVFEIKTDPAIFLYLDETVSADEVENTLAHELHHVGFGSVCPSAAAATEIKKTTSEKQKVFRWLGAFSEGLAMLAAAGGPDVHPHAASKPDVRARWDRDVADFGADLEKVEGFFRRLEAGGLSEKEEAAAAAAFYGEQGPWYTVGWQMAVVIEKTFGRRELIECYCNQQRLPFVFNRAVEKYNRRHRAALAGWSEDFLAKLKTN